MVFDEIRVGGTGRGSLGTAWQGLTAAGCTSWRSGAGCTAATSPVRARSGRGPGMRARLPGAAAGDGGDAGRLSDSDAREDDDAEGGRQRGGVDVFQLIKEHYAASDTRSFILLLVSGFLVPLCLGVFWTLGATGHLGAALCYFQGQAGMLTPPPDPTLADVQRYWEGLDSMQVHTSNPHHSIFPGGDVPERLLALPGTSAHTSASRRSGRSLPQIPSSGGAPTPPAPRPPARSAWILAIPQSLSVAPPVYPRKQPPNRNYPGMSLNSDRISTWFQETTLVLLDVGNTDVGTTASEEESQQLPASTRSNLITM